jgi:hypothetical protein
MHTAAHGMPTGFVTAMESTWPEGHRQADPLQGDGQALERAVVTAALHGVPLDFPDGGQRHMRTLRELTLMPAELADTIVNSPSDRSPVLGVAFRHAILRAPLPAPRLADPAMIVPAAKAIRNQAKAFRNTRIAQISYADDSASAGPAASRSQATHHKGPKAIEGTDAI